MSSTGRQERTVGAAYMPSGCPGKAKTLTFIALAACAAMAQPAKANEQASVQDWQPTTEPKSCVAGSKGPMDSLREGLEQFGYKQYHAAERSFEQAALKEPYSPKVHYYLGRTLLALDDPEGATREFKLSFQLDPFGPLGKLSKEGIMTASAMAAKEGMPVVEHPKVVEDTVHCISSQTRHAIDARFVESDIVRAQKMRDYNQTVQRVTDQLQEEMAATRWRGRSYAAYSLELTRRAQIETQRARNEALQQATIARAEATRRAAALQEAANNLDRLIAERPAPGQPHLRAYGTNLYVRYYGNDDPSAVQVVDDPIVELKATAQKAPNNWFQRHRQRKG